MKLVKLCCFLLVTIGLPATADEHGRDDAALASALGALDRFMAAFNARDIDAWADTLHYPHVRIASGSVSMYEGPDAFTDRPVFEMLTSTGWDHSHWISRKPVLVSADKVHLATVFQRFNARNEPIGTYESLYIVTKKDGEWGIQARSSLAP